MSEQGDSNTGGEPEARGTIFLSDITKVDCAVFDPSKGVFGQTWHVDVTVTGVLNPNGFVYDFSQLKKLVRQVMKSSIDHALIMPINSQSVQFKGMEMRGTEKSECWQMRSRAGKGGPELEWLYRGPSGTIFPTRSVSVNRQVLEQEVVRSLRHRLPEEILHISVALREEDVVPTEAMFRYTHGIAGHEGMCQRLLHGHRSRIHIFVGDERRPDLEHYVARDVLGANVHIATPKQFKAGMVEPGTRGKAGQTVTLGYQASNGYFEATFAADRVFSVERETSIECITLEIAKLIKREEASGDKVKVMCFEGVGKGAIAEL